MFYFTRLSNQVKLNIETGLDVDFPEVTLVGEYRDAATAELFRQHLRDQFRKAVEQAKNQAYNDGYKDGRGHRKKNNSYAGPQLYAPRCM